MFDGVAVSAVCASGEAVYGEIAAVVDGFVVYSVGAEAEVFDFVV